MCVSRHTNPWLHTPLVTLVMILTKFQLESVRKDNSRVALGVCISASCLCIKLLCPSRWGTTGCTQFPFAGTHTVTECQVSILRPKCFSKQAICARILQEPHSEMNLHCGYSFMCSPSQSTAWCALCTIKFVTEGGHTESVLQSHSANCWSGEGNIITL